MSESVIVGIHGLLNKVNAQTLENWWLKAIREGLERNTEYSGSSDFKLAYWANVRNRAPIAEGAEQEGYVPADRTGALERYVGSTLDKARAKAHEWFGRPTDWVKDLGNWDNTERLIGVKVADLSAYYTESDTRRRIRDALVESLRTNAHKRVMILSHSMGTIVAYDVLRELEDSSTNRVEHLVTLGSPLGLPLVSRNIREEFGDQRTPGNVREWTNFADPSDKVALDFNLADEFKANTHGIVPRDVLVRNGYVSESGEENAHKSYGYLRAPEVSAVVRDFLVG